uniref:BED-type domain-containing protein n=1 Tax=Xiphophorus maculatus TaxID=8083 RepID=M4AVU6_XIPMA
KLTSTFSSLSSSTTLQVNFVFAHSWKYRNYFEFLSAKNDNNIKVHCTLCAGQKVLATFKNATSNLRKHLELQHGTVKLMEVPPGGSTQRAATGGPPPLKQQKLNFGAKPVSERELKQLIGQYVVEEMMPLSTVDLPAFRTIIHRIPTTANYELPHRGAFSAYLEKEHAEMERNLKAALNEVDFVSTTADIWTANGNNRSYTGVTLHWIHRATTLERNKSALACRRIRGRHTYDVIGAEIKNIHSSYGLLNKVVATVTDNGSNFVKAFKGFQPITESDDETEEESTRTDDDDDVTFLNLTEILSAENEGDGQHHRCTSHTINIISTSDVEKYLTSHAESKAIYRSSIAKCTALGTKSSRSTLLLVPTSTRWNSFSDAVKRVAEIPLSDLNTLNSKLGVKCFTDREYQFLHEYCTVMKPMTAALDILQDSLSRMTAGLPDAIVQVYSITRFASLLDDKDALLAAVSCPKFKLRWLRDAGRREQVKELLVAECRKVVPAPHSPTTTVSQGEMDFFTFEPQPEETYSAEQEVMDYLRSAYDLEILHRFRNIKKIFLKYNTPTPSSAPVERRFCLGGLVLTPRRNRLSDRRFGKTIVNEVQPLLNIIFYLFFF